MGKICANIRENRLEDILKWMTGIDDKDRELFFTQLPSFEAKRLSAAWNMDSLMHSNFPEKNKDAWERCVEFCYCWLMSISRPVIAGTPTPRTMPAMTPYERPDIPINRLHDFVEDRLQLSLPVEWLPELTPSSTSPFFAQEGSYSPPMEGLRTFATVAQSPVADTQPCPPYDETYSSTWTKDDISTFVTETLSNRFPGVGKARVESLFAQVYETIESENKDNTTHSSELRGQKLFGSSGSRYSYTTSESWVQEYN